MRKKNKNKIIERLIVSSEVSDNSFDANFWKKAGSNCRFVAMWSMVKDLYKLKGKNGDKLRLQRSVQNIEQI